LKGLIQKKREDEADILNEIFEKDFWNTNLGFGKSRQAVSQKKLGIRGRGLNLVIPHFSFGPAWPLPLDLDGPKSSLDSLGPIWTIWDLDLCWTWFAPKTLSQTLHQTRNIRGVSNQTKKLSHLLLFLSETCHRIKSLGLVILVCSSLNQNPQESYKLCSVENHILWSGSIASHVIPSCLTIIKITTSNFAYGKYSWSLFLSAASKPEYLGFTQKPLA